MNPVATIEVPQNVLDSARLTPEEARVELAVHLYTTHRLGFGKARELAGISHSQFRHLLAGRDLPAHYGVSELEEDLAALDRFGVK